MTPIMYRILHCWSG